ncbi:MAG: hypothetical protein KBA75_03925 [Alphaproteobacteria bacterium]|nr:hypothetical protein [Alphaproteobacteria bacterium]
MMTATINPHAIPLDPRVTITVARNTFTGHVSGGGTRGGPVVKTGYTLRITNNENALRSYYFSVGIFSDHANKVVRETIPRHVAHVQSGQMMEVDIELPQREDFGNAYLIDFVISQGSQTPLAHYTPDYPLALAAEPNGPDEDDSGLDFFYFLVVIELLFVGLIVGSVASMHYHANNWVSWGSGIGSFWLGCMLLKNASGRGALYVVFSAIWALLALGKFGLLEAIGVFALSMAVHWWLRSPARAVQRALRAKRSDLANRM